MRKYKRESVLLNSFEVTTGGVVKISPGVKSGGGLVYYYKERQSKYKAILGLVWPSCKDLVKANLTEMKKHSFPVVISKYDPDNSEILIFKNQYDKYDIEVPDRLKEIVEDLSKCKEWNL